MPLVILGFFVLRRVSLTLYVGDQSKFARNSSMVRRGSSSQNSRKRTTVAQSHELGIVVENIAEKLAQSVNACDSNATRFRTRWLLVVEERTLSAGLFCGVTVMCNRLLIREEKGKQSPYTRTFVFGDKTHERIEQT